MRQIKFVVIAVVALAFSACQSTAPVAKRGHVSAGAKRHLFERPAFKRPALKSLKFRPINTDIPKTKRVVLSDGMVVHLVPDHELPLFNIQAMIRVGAIWEPGYHAGLAGLTGAGMRAGGSREWPPDKLDETLEYISGAVETSIGEEKGSASLSVLLKDAELGLKIFADVLRHPRFDPDRLEIVRAKMLDSIRRENDDPTGVAQRELNKLIYAGSPYGRYPTMEAIRSISREDIINFHKTYFVPQNIMLGVTGDFDEKTIIDKLEKLFGDWKGETPEYAHVPPVREKFEGGVYLSARNIPQSVIRMGHLAGRRTDPDYHAIRIMDAILGGSGFTSRLVKSVRVDRGLAYSVWSYNMAGRWELGRFLAGAETKASSTAQVIGLMKSEIERIRNSPVTQEELDNAKKSIVNSFIFIFDRPSTIMGQRMIVDYYGLPDDYLESYRDKIMAVTADDVMEAARKHLHPDGLKIVVVGDPEQFDKPLSEFGEVKQIVLSSH